MARKSWLRSLTIGIALNASVALAATPLTTGITYQGRLAAAGEAINGTADFEFTLWDSDVDGLMIGNVLVANDVPVTDGAFTVELDFGPSAFNGDARWLEIDVRSPAGGGAFSTLTPRQPVTASPYALNAQRAARADRLDGVFVSPQGRVGIGTESPSQRLSVVRDVGVLGVGDLPGALTVFGPNGNENVLLTGNPLFDDVGELKLFNSAGEDRVMAVVRPGVFGGGGAVMVKNSDGDITGRIEGGLDSFITGGSFGIGTTTPSHKLDVVGNIAARSTGANSSGQLFTYGPNGNQNFRVTFLNGNPDHGFLSLKNADGEDRVTAVVGPDGSGTVSTRGVNGSSNVVMQFLSGFPDHGFLSIRDANSDSRVTAFVNASAAGQLNLRSFDGAVNVVARGAASDDSAAQLLQVRGPSTQHVATFRNENPDGKGIAIRIDNPDTNTTNNFVTFVDGMGRTTGRIEGWDAQVDDWITDPPPLPELELDINFPTLSFTTTVIDIPLGPTFTIINPTSLALSLPSNPFNLPSDNDITGESGALRAYLTWSMANGLGNVVSLDPMSIATNSAKLALTKVANDRGVIYGTKGADYAEWLPKEDPNQQFKFGQIVGIRGGRVSLDTEGAEQIMIVSQSPAVVGNQPAEGEEDAYVAVGFMGQLMAAVRGAVHAGDYIVPSGLNDGIAIAIAPEDLTTEHLDRIVGRAWTDSTNPVFDFVNVVVGVDHQAAKHVLARVELENGRLARELSEIRGLLNTVLETRVDDAGPVAVTSN